MVYKLHPEYTWNGVFYAAALADFREFGVSAGVKGLDARLSMHTVREIVVDDLDGYHFPLKNKYDYRTDPSAEYF